MSRAVSVVRTESFGEDMTQVLIEEISHKRKILSDGTEIIRGTFTKGEKRFVLFFYD